MFTLGLPVIVRNSARPECRGAEGTLVAHDESSNRWQVCLLNNEIVGSAAASLLPAPGARLRLTGLVRRADLNETVIQAGEYDASKERLQVHLPSGAPISVKLENFRALV